MRGYKIIIYGIIMAGWLFTLSGCATMPRGRIEVKGEIGRSYQVGVEVETKIPGSEKK
ncbi:MAG: hypothetical protein GXO71_01470 [Caldiserica bacterium]|nr:hypothetical protein [Caldisericota bacterium]